MKKKYVTPCMTAELFEANEYVAACIEGKAYCAIPGQSQNKVNDGTRAVWGPDGMQHGGPCSSNNKISFPEGGSTGVETSTGHTIYNISIGSEVTGLSAECSSDIGSNTGISDGHYYYATWTNKDGTYATPYNHYGIIYISDIIKNRPNHS